MSDEERGLSDETPIGRISRFEDLVAWQKARLLTTAVYRMTRTPPFRTEQSLANQLQRAATSTMANIAESFDRGSRAEFYRFLSTAKGSCAEVRSHLYVALDAGLLSRSDFETMVTQTEEVSRIIGGLRAAVGRQRDDQRRRKHS